MTMYEQPAVYTNRFPTPSPGPWASTAATAGLAAPMIPLHEAPIRAALGDTDDWRHRYRAFIRTPPDSPAAVPPPATRKAPFQGPLQ